MVQRLDWDFAARGSSKVNQYSFSPCVQTTLHVPPRVRKEVDDMNSNILGLYDQLAKLSAELKVGETTEEPLGKTNLNTCISGSPESGFKYSIQGSASCPPSLSKARNCLALSQFAHLPRQSSTSLLWRLRLAMWASLERKTRQQPQQQRVSAKKGLETYCLQMFSYTG